MEQAINLKESKMSKLGIKIFIIMILVATSGLLIAGLYLNYNISRNFEEYLYHERKDKIEQLVNLLENNYSETADWIRGKIILSEFVGINRLPLRLVDVSGKVIYDYRQLPTPGMMGEGMMHQGRMERMLGNHPGISFEVFDLKKDGKEIAHLYWYQTREEAIAGRAGFFIDRVNRVIIMSALLVTLITALISFAFSRYLTEPLLKINRAAGKVAEGDLNHKVVIRGNDEITELSRSFNEMVDKLRYLEKIRKESTSDLAHELRTPLTNIKGYLEGIKEGIFDINEEVIMEIEEELERLIRLVNRMTELTAAEKRIINNKKQELVLKPLLAEVVSNYRPQAVKKGINLTVEYPEEEIKLDADSDNLKVIIHNLLSNALKYTPEGGKILIRLFKKDNQLVLEIKDTGIGIKPEDQNFIFERFYRADKSRSSKTGGIGIGLTITRELVHSLGGQIMVNSEGEGKGTIFRILLPVN
jgi:signal transduction histidine kinase